MDESHITNLLEKLGLTEYEAKTLSALFRLKESEAPEVSRIAQVPKTRVYDVLDRLVKKGLIIEVYGRPKKYMVVDASDAFEGLITKKKTEIIDLEKQAHQLKNVIEEFQTVASDDSEKVMKVKSKDDYIKILSQEIDEAQDNVIAFTELKKDHDLLHTALKQAAGKKISVKLLSHPPEHKNLMNEIKKHGVNLKQHDHGLSAFVIDGRKVILGLSDFSKEKPEYHFAIWNNHEGLTSALTSYFDNCWTKAKK